MSLHHLLMMSYDAGVVSAFPTLEGTATTATSTAFSPRSMNLPSGITAGELLMLFISSQSLTINTPSGWTALTAKTSGNALLYPFYKTASGSEGSTVSVSWASSSRVLSSVAMRISGFTGTPSEGTATTNADSSTNDIDPPNLNTGVSAKYLWIAAGSFQTGRTISSAPTNYTDRSSDAMAVATRNLEASQENPGAFTLGGGQTTQGYANTYAVKGT